MISYTNDLKIFLVSNSLSDCLSSTIDSEPSPVSFVYFNIFKYNILFYVLLWSRCTGYCHVLSFVFFDREVIFVAFWNFQSELGYSLPLLKDVKEGDPRLSPMQYVMYYLLCICRCNHTIEFNHDCVLPSQHVWFHSRLTLNASTDIVQNKFSLKHQ